MQLMKQNGIQVNNNNSNSTERLSAQQQQQQRPQRAAGQSTGEVGCIRQRVNREDEMTKSEKNAKHICLNFRAIKLVPGVDLLSPDVFN